MIIYLHGEDDFRSEQALHGLVEAFRKKHDPAGLGIASFDGERVTAEELQRAFTTQGLLSKRRLTVVRRLGSSKKSGPAEEIDALLEAGRLPTDHIAIFWEAGNPESGKRVSKLFQRLAQLPARQPKSQNQDYQERFDPLVGRQLERWADAFATERETRLTPSARAQLISLTEGNLRLIAQEIEKLSHFRPKDTITDQDIVLFVHSQLEPNIFDLTDTIGERDLPRALELLERQFIAGSAPLYLVTMLTRHFRILRSIQASGSDHPSTLARTLRLHPFVVGKALKQVQRFSNQDLVHLFDRIVALDDKLKSSATDPAAELMLFVAQACGAVRSHQPTAVS